MLISKIRNLCLGLISGATFVMAAPFQYFDPTNLANIPQLLSQTGVYNNTNSKILDTAAKYYEVNAALWSDGSSKTRWVILQPGKKIPYNDTTDFFNYPDSTVFVKTFKLDKVEGDSTPNSSRVYWETRLLVKKLDPINRNDWYGFSYRWRADQTDADLVSLTKGKDTVFYYTDSQKKQTYKKWHFPSQSDCAKCHRPEFSNKGTDTIFGRAVLGFYPAQLKRPSTLIANSNQVTQLFVKGVFSGTQPTISQLAVRLKGIHEAISPSLSPAERFATIDTMARSYIAANCSGCHGYRGKAVGAPGEAGAEFDFDFYNLKPKIEVGMHRTLSYGMNDLTPYDTANSSSSPSGRAYWLINLKNWGVDTSAGKVYDMRLPPGDPFALIPAMVYPSYPALSEVLFRQWARNSPWTDSAAVARNLKYNLDFGDSAAAASRRSWIFSKPWGSQAWLTLLSQKGLTMDSILTPRTGNALSSGSLIGWNANQMPPLATTMPDTAALTILAEWVKTYRTLVVVDPNHVFTSIKRNNLVTAAPMIRNHTLILPDGLSGRVMMLDMRGRSYDLIAVGKGMYALPTDASLGVYFIKVGSKIFKSSML